jgi:hypothetical protein
MSPRSSGCGPLRSGLVKGMTHRVTAANSGEWLRRRPALLALAVGLLIGASAVTAAAPGRWLAPEVQRATFRPVNGALARRQPAWPRRATDSPLGVWYQPVARFRPDSPAEPAAAAPRSAAESAEAEAHAQFRPFARPHISDSGEAPAAQLAWFGAYPLYVASLYPSGGGGWPLMTPFPRTPLPFWGVPYGTVTPYVSPPLVPYAPWPHIPPLVWPYWSYR